LVLSFDDHKNSAGFTKHFGYGHTEFNGMLLIADQVISGMTILDYGGRSDSVT